MTTPEVVPHIPLRPGDMLHPERRPALTQECDRLGYVSDGDLVEAKWIAPTR